MTKAKDALEWFLESMHGLKIPIDVGKTCTIRKALELLDKVENGGCDINTPLKQVEIFYGDDFKRQNTAAHIVKSMGEKYILIERKENDGL